MRLYFDMNEDPFVFQTFCNLSCQHSNNLDLCDVRNLPGVNFTNILRAPFCTKVSRKTFLRLHFWFELFLVQEFWRS
jgi:hypothetical protein